MQSKVLGWMTQAPQLNHMGQVLGASLASGYSLVEGEGQTPR